MGVLKAVVSGFAANKPGKLQLGVLPADMHNFAVETKTPRPYINRCVKELGNILDFQVNCPAGLEEKIKLFLGKNCLINIKCQYYKFADKTGRQIEGYKFTVEGIEEQKNM